ncbi:putative Cyclophilin type peptidyl prolyl cis trans isomerase [Trypanosoma vivax]|uniref:Peptidyl-prolyl cis-trans isomerase n=1 Tax=Trypanosoma vivax (strain Y486) TaxID=1055687 RepID=F9WUZ0_TRYVY|nr:putative Cyclophilin type peptidyl prolyl cis trans isomerase [Trypanosoma vivax]CCD21390.1 cyclophilin, putative [Trypanosoma vivax Y486]|eukprot:CCD21390.1 cyclophilin, putative [Trypanosoma vivax Y486]
MLRQTGTLLASFGGVFMDVAIGLRSPRRIEFKLFTRKCPEATENFTKLCTGGNVLPRVPSTSGLGDPSFADQFLPQLTYKNSIFHRVVKGYLIQGGDVTSGRGTGQLSIYGETFVAPDEVVASVFDRRGLVGTANSAPHLNGSQFFILTANGASHLNGTCICFACIANGYDVVEAIEQLQLEPSGFPSERVAIVDCGVLK